MMRYSMSGNAGHLAHAERGAPGARRTRGSWRTPNAGHLTHASAPAAEEGRPPGGTATTGLRVRKTVCVGG
jgi:hypothetical protein